ncbi:MAG: preprotein translocase subunit SecG [Proteobacteria bacterium]|nr:preprotein translocase subunit SecG [Pseudomonadota bacterium]
MLIIVLVIHVLIALALIGVVLLQRSEGGALGMGGGSGGGGLMSGRSAGNVLTKSRGVLGAAFMATSIMLAVLSGRDGGSGSFLDEPPPPTQTEQAPPEEPPAPAVPLDR